MTLPYPLLARGKIIDTDMSLGQNYAPGLEGAEKIEALERRIKAYQESEMSNAVAVRNQVVLTLFPLLKDGVSIEDGISRAALISDFILNGQHPASPTPEPKGPFMGGIGSDNRTYPFTNEHGKHFRIEYDGVFNSIIIAYEDGVNVRHTLDELPHAGK